MLLSRRRISGTVISVSDGETVTIGPGFALDAQQNPIRSAGSEFDIDGCIIEPLGSDESSEYGRSGTVTRIKIYTPGPVERPIEATDTVTLRGHVWDIEGQPDDWLCDDPDLSGPVVIAQRGIG